MSSNAVSLFIPAALLLTLVSSSSALRCYQCGQYTDGVGSITPCINHTDRHLKECPKPSQHHCIKFVTEGSIVRDCASECTEKRESWGTKVFCCNEDACNAATAPASPLRLLPVSLFLWQVVKLTY